MKLICLVAFTICCLAQSNATVTQTVKETVTATVTAAPTTMSTMGSTYPSVTSAEPTFATATSIAPTCTKPPMPGPDVIPYGHAVVYHPENCTYTDALIPDDITPPALGPPEVKCDIKWWAGVDTVDISWSDNTGITPELLHRKLGDCGSLHDFILWNRADADPDHHIHWDKAAPNAEWWVQAVFGLGKHYCVQDSIKKAGYHGEPFTCSGLGY